VITIINNVRWINMPGRNRTGPNGKGPMTGRGLGQCQGIVDAEPAFLPQGSYSQRQGSSGLRGLRRSGSRRAGFSGMRRRRL